MTRLWRPAAVLFLLLSALLLAHLSTTSDRWRSVSAHGVRCVPQPNCDPKFSPPPPGTPQPETPAPTKKPPPTPSKTATPTQAPARRTFAPSGGSSKSTSAPDSLSGVEVPTTEPFSTPEIIVDGPVGQGQPLDVAEPSASASSWIFGFVVGLLIGGFVGRASWGLRRKRRQQIFG